MTPKKTVLILVDLSPATLSHQDILNELNDELWETERDVYRALIEMNLSPEFLIVNQNLNILIEKIKTLKPDLIFNLCEAFNNQTTLEPNIVALLEMLKQTYTGCNFKSLLWCKDKAIAKKLAQKNYFKTPQAQIIHYPNSDWVLNPELLPALVKSRHLESSVGLAQNSYVTTADQAYKRVEWLLQKTKQDVLIEEFIDGTEYFVAGIRTRHGFANSSKGAGLIYQKNDITIFFPQQLSSQSTAINPFFLTYQAKWDDQYRQAHQIKTHKALLSAEQFQTMAQACARYVEELELTGYFRFDLKISNSGILYFLEVNANPSLAKKDDFAQSAKHSKVSYLELIQAITQFSQDEKPKHLALNL